MGLFFATHGETGGAASGPAVPGPSDPVYNRWVVYLFVTKYLEEYERVLSKTTLCIYLHAILPQYSKCLRVKTMCIRGGPLPEILEEQVRAPLPVMRDRLYGETFMSRGTTRPQQQQEVQAFRDFK